MFVPLGHLVTTGVTVSHAQIVNKILCEGRKKSFPNLLEKYLDILDFLSSVSQKNVFNQTKITTIEKFPWYHNTIIY